MSWVKRVGRFFLGGGLVRDSRVKGGNAPRGRRVTVEALEDRRLLSVGGSYDFGDLPDNYGTTLAADGARHEATGPKLGTLRDAETDGLPTLGADGDDTQGSADEDGVTFGAIMVGQLDATATVNVQNAPSGAKLDAWIDFSGDGSFGGAGEQIADTLAVAEGDNLVEFDVPSWADPGETYARFRLSTSGDLAPVGVATSGEVEDCQVAINKPPAGGGGFVSHDLGTEAVDGLWVASAADMDSDGDMDVIAGSAGNSTIAWYENDGNGRFTAHTIPTAAKHVRSVSATDVDGDGDMDVLSAWYSSGTIAWYENDGNEGFTQHVVSTGASGASSVHAADLDGDGDMDLLSASRINDNVTWYENDGNSGFTQHVIYSHAKGAVSVFAVDMDGDGDMDVLSASCEDDTIAWYENDGTATFTRHTVTTSTWWPESVFAADVDADGDMDVLSATTSQVAWYENSGNGVFTHHALSAGGAKSVFAADLDGDGAMDVLSYDGGIVNWYRNEGNATFSTHKIADSPEAGWGVYPADLNGDGTMDVLSSFMTSGIFWYEQVSQFVDCGDAPDSYGTTLAAGGPRHEPIGPRLGAKRDTEVDGMPIIGAEGDDADGEDDEDGVSFGSSLTIGQSQAVATVNVQNASTGAMLDAWVDFDGDGVFGNREQVAISTAVSEGDNDVVFDVPAWAVAGETYARFRLSSSGDLAPGGAAADGEVEDHTVSILAPLRDFGDAPDNYGTTISADGAWHATTGPRLGDERDSEVDGLPTGGADGDDTGGADDEDGVSFDSAIVVGQLDVAITVNVQNAPSGARLDAWIDFNGDGSFGGTREQIADSWHVSEGDNVLEIDVPSWSVPGTTYGRFRLSSVGDLASTGGALDGEIEDYQVTIAPAWSPEPVFPVQHEVGKVIGDPQSPVAAADFNGDGLMDIVSGSYIGVFGTDAGRAITVYENNGNGKFTQHTFSSPFNVTSIVAEDVNGDGYIDIVSATGYGGSLPGGTVGWYENDGKGGFTRHSVNSSAGPAQSVSAADVNGDGHMDMLSATRYYSGLAWYENDGHENFTEHKIGGGALSVFAADLNGDGRTDVLSGSEYGLAWNENSGSASFTAHAINTSIEQVRSVHAADLNGDGHLDILAAHRGDTIAWFENDGAGSFTEHTIGEIANSGSTISGADIDGDGDMDVLALARLGDREIAWYENDGNGNFTKHAIADGLANRVVVVDLDGDGQLDLLGTGSLDGVNSSIIWFENTDPIDYGDAPDSYGTTLGADGARHWDTGPRLGAIRDADSDGHATRGADGDDTTTSDDEDGVLFGSVVIVGLADRAVTINVQEAPSGAKLDAWIDFDGNGTFDAGDQIADSIDVTEGDNVILFGVPDSAIAGQTYARFRLSTVGDLEPTGEADDGEVEDYVLHILSGPADFGDAPDSYGTTLAATGALHETAGPRLGSNRDTETDGLPSTDANGDDGDGDADEDGVTFESVIPAGRLGATITVNVQDAPSGAKLDAWIDYNQDGSFGENERIAHDLPVSEGDNVVDFDVPDGAQVGTTYARFRLSSAGGLGPTGAAHDGEVEDYMITIVAKRYDFGDAPDSYGTLASSDGAEHVATGPTLGALRDGEADGLPSPVADGDDGDRFDDEDGVTFASTTFVAAATVNVQNAPNGAKVDAWIDFDQDGSFDGPGEQIADSLRVVEGDNLVTYLIPEGTVPGETYARFRLSSAGGLGPTGSAADGEVEDYVVTIIPEDTPYYQHVDRVNVGYGVVANRSLPADIGEDYIIRGSLVYYRQGDQWYVTDEDNVETPSEDRYRVVREGSTLLIQQYVEGEWRTDGEFANFGGMETYFDGTTVAVVSWQSGYYVDSATVQLIEKVDGVWQVVHTIDSLEADSVKFSNGTLGIAQSGYYYEPPGWTSHPILSVGYVALFRKFEGEWRGTWRHAEYFDAGSHIFEDWDDGFGTGVFVGGTRAFGTGDEYCLDFRWNESSGTWSVLDWPRGDDYFTSIKLDGDVLVFDEGQSGLTISWGAGEGGLPFEGDVGFLAANEEVALLGVSGTNEVRWYDLDFQSDTEEFLVPAKEGGELTVSVSGRIVPTVEVYDPAGQLIASADSSTLTCVASSMGVYTVKTTVETNWWRSYDVSILSELPQAGETVDLGVVDDAEVLDALGEDDAREYTLEAARDGYLTVLAHEEEVSENLAVALLDQDGAVVAAASAVGASGTWPHEWRLEHAVTGGESYRVLVMGDGEVDLRICNLVSQTGSTVEVFDTDGDDAYLFTISDTFNLTANGVEYKFDDAAEFAFHSTGGLDVIEMVDSDGDDTLNVSPDQVVMSGTTLGGTAFSATANNFHAAHGYAKSGGKDRAEFVGGEKGERVKAYEGLVKMMGGDYFARAKFFECVDVEMGAGVDTAVVVPSTGADVVWASGLEVRVAHNVEDAESVASELAAAGGSVTIDGAERIVARARGGDDWVELHDSVFDDVFIAKPNKVEMMNGPGDVFERGELYRIVARGFGHVSAIADGGGDADVAKLYDSGEEGVDVWAAGYLDGETWSTMTSPSRLLYEVLAFEHVGGYGFNGGLGEGHGTNRKEHADDVDFVFQYGYWEGDETPVRRPRGRGVYAGR